MNHHASTDLLIVGAGPAGMAAARRAVRGGLSVVVLDSQSQPGGQIWRNAGRNATSPVVDVLGAEYRRGITQVEAFMACGANYIPDAQVSRLSQGWTVEYVRGEEIRPSGDGISCSPRVRRNARFRSPAGHCPAS